MTRSRCSSASLFDSNQRDIKDQCRVGWNGSGAITVRAIPQIRRDNQAARATDLHSLKPFIPALDHLCIAQIF